MKQKRRFPSWEIYRCTRCWSMRRIPRFRKRPKNHHKPMFCAFCQGVSLFRKVGG